ncbi:bromodomain adjacent to zinc finger domain protein 2A [Alligator sinensis]|uniref:Bromodomain adjacent to zinc finger domain protein 2A n=1 Tax=Alligator sinensis TaxID=38654 RepID=A0A3Q0FHT6_ALLSI|nr:bromodomain adjacent to zinc finger domain protein 2A [Alligator sinensis]
METNNHFGFAGLPSAPTASGLKPTPASGDSLYANGAPTAFPLPGKGLNGDMNVNGLSTVSHTSTSGTFNSPTHSPAAPPLHPCDYLWNYSQYPASGAGGLKDGPGLGQYPLNGLLSGGRPPSPGHSPALRGGAEFWGNGTPGSMGLNFDSQELYDSFPDQSFELLPNGPGSFYTASQPSPMLGTSGQAFSPPHCPQDDPDAGAERAPAGGKDTPPAVSENGAGLVGSLELEDTQADLKMCGYNGSAPSMEPLSRDASHWELGSSLPPLFASSWAWCAPHSKGLTLWFWLPPADPGTGDLYEMDSSQLVSDKSPLEEPPDISALTPAGSFALLADDSQASSSSLFASPRSPPVLGESVLQDSSLDLNHSSDPGPEEPEPLELDPPLAPESPARSPSPEEEEEEDEEAGDEGCPEVSAVPEADGEEAAPLSTSISGKHRGPQHSPPPRTMVTSTCPLPAAETPRRRIATEEEVRFPLQHGWRREVRIKKGNHRWQGETWYYGPCGKRMKQFPEVIKYLSRNAALAVRREHFSFSPRMPVGDFYEERDMPEGLQWVRLTPDEIPARIQAITGKRGRPRNAEKAQPKDPPPTKRGRGRPPKLCMLDLLSKTDARLLRRLEAQEVLSDEDKLKMSKIKKKMRRKAKNKQKQEAKAPKAKEAKKKGKAKEKRGKAEKAKEKPRAKDKKGKGGRKADKVLLAQRRAEERRRHQSILEEMKKPTEDMCLGDHQPLPTFSRIPGLVLPSTAFSACLATVEFLHSYGKVLGFDVPRDVPSLSALQDGLLGLGQGPGQLQDLLVRLLQAALYDPGLPAYCQSLKILGEKVSEISLTRDTVSEILRCFLAAHGAGAELCAGLHTQPFQALPPEHKAAVLAFLINELNSSALIINEIDKTLESMSNYRKNKWIIEGKLRRLKLALARKTGHVEGELPNPDEGRRRRSSRLTEENSGLEPEEEDETRGHKSRKEEEAEASASSIPELERQIEKLTKRQMFFRKKLLQASQTLRAASLGQDRYQRQYWVLPHLGGIFVEGTAGAAAMDDAPKPELPSDEAPLPPAVKPEPAETPVSGRPSCAAARARGRPRKSREEPVGPPPQPPPNGLLEEPGPGLGLGQHDLTQSAFLSWLSQTQAALLHSAVLTPESSPGAGGAGPPPAPSPGPEDSTADKPGGPWLNLLPRMPCADTTGSITTSPPDQPTALGMQPPPPGVPPTPPAEMQSGWWWLREPEELEAVARALHPRGIREKVLHKHLAKHKDFLREVCQRPPTDPIFQAGTSPAAPAGWSAMEQAFEVDLAVLRGVEELEQRVLQADLQIRGWMCPSPDSVRGDLQYCEHKAEALEELGGRGRREGPVPRREASNPLDLAVLRLGALEQNVERRYLKEPLWAPHDVVLEKALLTGPLGSDLGGTEIAYEITPRMRTWRQTLERCRSAAQVSLCICQLEKSIAWEKSVNKVTCLVCRRGDDDEHLLLCDGCDRGCHLYCHQPKMAAVPEGDWFCSICLAQASGEYPPEPGSPRRGKKRKRGRLFGGGFAEEDESPRRRAGPRHDSPAVPRYSGEGLSPAKRRRVSPRGQSSDLTFCEIILMEMESHEDAWPFLEPVNPRLVPGYRKIIKNPMDFATMRTRLLRGGYMSSEEFLADALLVFDNCQTFNEDESEVGRAGRAMRRFFESRWEEFYQGKQLAPAL